MIPDNVEKIIMTKEDYDRNVEQLLYDKINAEQEIERLHSIIKEAREYITDEQDKQSEFSNFYNAFIDDITISVEYILEILDKEKDNE